MIDRVDRGRLVVGLSSPGYRAGDGVVGAWRELHFASQALVEVGKSWRPEEADDSHSAMLVDVGRGALVSKAGELEGRLFMETLELSVGVGRIEANGMTLADLSEWVRDRAREAAGEPLQAGRPAPDLPESPIAKGAAFRAGVDAPEALASLASMYTHAAGVLDRFDGIADGPALCWPHHFDLASLVWVQANERSIGIGLTPPDGIEASGYWYVSPWSRSGDLRALGESSLEAGAWQGGAGASMAVLPVQEIERAGDLSSQADLVAAFISDAFSACLEAQS